MGWAVYRVEKQKTYDSVIRTEHLVRVEETEVQALECARNVYGNRLVIREMPGWAATPSCACGASFYYEDGGLRCHTCHASA